MTLRTRLVVSLVAVAIILGLVGWFVANSQRGYLVSQLDGQLNVAVGPSLRLGGGRQPGQRGSPAPRVAAGTQAPESVLSELFVGELHADGELDELARPGPSDRGRPIVTLDDAIRHTAEDNERPVPFTASATEGAAPYRVVVRSSGNGQTYRVVGLSMAHVAAAQRRLIVAFGVGALLLFAGLGAVGLWVVRLGLRPIHHMTEAADAIAQGDLSRRVETFPVSTEAGHLSRAFNLMLDERQASEDRLRQFVADASHELRTPLTSIRGYLQLYRRGGLAGEGELDDALRRVGQEAERMSSLVEDLLLLARLDEKRPLSKADIDVASFLSDAGLDASARQPDRPVLVDSALSLDVIGDDARLRQVLGVLVDNVLVHTPVTAKLTLAGTRSSDRALVVVEVGDDGPGMAPELAERVFERFARGDSARTRNQGGSGLGLAIARSIVEAHGGRISLTSGVDRGTVVRVELPAVGGGATG